MCLRTLKLGVLVSSVVILGLAAGCSSRGNVPISSAEAIVKGTVTVAGKPLAGGKVIFESARGSREATIEKDGTYSLTTAVGGNTVNLRVPKGFKSSAVANYTAICDVLEGKDNEFTINLASRGREN